MAITVNAKLLDEQEVAEEAARLRPKHDDRDAAGWMKRREEILAQYREQVYGYCLLRPAEFPRGLRPTADLEPHRNRLR